MVVEDLYPDSRFLFECGPHLECFTECCKRLKLVLTPYDCLRLKEHLKMGSDQFLEEYCDLRYDEGIFPVYYLRMGQSGICPFVSKEGCMVYSARPAACRLYPVGKGSTYVKGKKEIFFLLKEEHCLGHRSNKEWTVEEWIRHEGVDEYDRVNTPWIQIVTSGETIRKDNWEKKLKMFLMASYNIDKFREFVFGSKFLKMFGFDEEEKYKLSQNDDLLLEVAIEYLKLIFLGKSRLDVRR